MLLAVQKLSDVKVAIGIDLDAFSLFFVIRKLTFV